MSQWCRLWEDMPNDPKWRVVAKRAGRPVSEVLAVFVHMMTNASNAIERGELQGWNDEDVAIAIDAETAHVAAIREAMQGKTLDGNHLTGWEKRQPLREDGGAERARAWRERKKHEKEQIERVRTQENAPEPPEERRIEDAAAAAREASRPIGKSLEQRCREAVGQEPVCCATDFLAIEELLADGLTEADVLAGITEGLDKANSGYRFRHWRNFAGWIRTAAKNRMEGKPRANGARASPKQPDDPDDPTIEFPGGFKRPTSFVVEALVEWRRDPRTWPYRELSAAPDSPGCRVPLRLLEQVGIVFEGYPA